MNNLTKYYEITSDLQVMFLGECESFDEAEELCSGNCMYIATANSLKGLVIRLVTTLTTTME